MNILANVYSSTLPFLLGLLSLLTLTAHAEIVEEPVAYVVDGHECTGVLVYDDSSPLVRPGVVLVPNWKGINDNAITRARMIAGRDYVVFIADMYGTSVRPTTSDEARAAATAVRENRATMQARGLAAITQLRTSNAPIDPSRIAAIGFCFGGGTVLELARIGAPIDAVVSFHGDLVSPTKASAEASHPRILVAHGAVDPLVPMSDVAAFVDEMESAGADYQLLMLSGAVHSFTNPEAATPGLSQYQAEAASRAYAAMSQLFSEVW